MDILVIASDKKLTHSRCRAYDSELESGDLTVFHSHDNARSELNKTPYDLIIADIGLLDSDSRVLWELTDIQSGAPLFVLAAEETEIRAAKSAISGARMPGLRENELLKAIL